MPGKITAEKLQEVVDTFQATGSNYAKAALLLGIPRPTVQSRMEQARRRGITPRTADPNDPLQLKSQIKRLQSDLRDAQQERVNHAMIKHKIIGLTREVADVTPPTWMKSRETSHSKPGVPTLLVSDLHWGEVVDGRQINGVNQYNLDIAHSRIKHLAERAVRLCEIISPKMEYPGLVLPLGGDMFCFPGETWITMGDGTVKEIKDILPGEIIIGRHGPAEVLHTHKRQATQQDQSITLSTAGSIDVTVTEGHVFAIIPRECVESGWNTGGRQNRGFVIRQKYGLTVDDMIWRAAKDIRPGDYLISRPDRSESTGAFLDIPAVTGLELESKDGLLVRKVRGTSPSVISSAKVEVTNELLWLMGVFVAEGSVSIGRSGRVNGAQISFHIRETDLAERVVSICQRCFGYTPKIEEKPVVHTRNVHINNQIIATLLHNLCGRLADQVRLHPILWGLNRSLLPLVAGWFDGEGCLSKTTRSLTGKTVSARLARQLVSILQTEGCLPNYKLDDHGRHRTAHVIRLTGASAQLVASYSVRFKNSLDTFCDAYNETLVLDDALAYRVRFVKSVKTAETVFDLTIDGHPSYHANGYLVHNSGNIHDELTATNELNSMPCVLDLYGALVRMIKFFLEYFPAVFIPCVTGNHGRDTRKIWSKDRHHTSFDWLLYCLLAKYFEDNKRVTFLIPDGPDAYYQVYSHTYILSHGDQFRGGDGVIGILGPIVRGDHKKRSRNMQIHMGYDTMLCGHFHQYVQLQRLIVNGSLKGYDEYAYANNFPYEPAQQALWLTHPTYRITYRMPVQVQQFKDVKVKPWVSIVG